MADKCLAKPSRSLLQLASHGIYMERINYDSATASISVFIQQRDISFQKNHEIRSLIMRKVRKLWDSRQNHELDQLWSRRAILLLIFLSCLSPGWVKKFQKFINFCLKVGCSANSKHSKSTRRLWSCDSCEKYKISTSRTPGTIYLRQSSFWYRALSRRADWFTKGVYIWVIHLHIALSTITCSLRYTQSTS